MIFAIILSLFISGPVQLRTPTDQDILCLAAFDVAEGIIIHQRRNTEYLDVIRKSRKILISEIVPNYHYLPSFHNSFLEAKVKLHFLSYSNQKAAISILVACAEQQTRHNRLK